MQIIHCIQTTLCRVFIICSIQCCHFVALRGIIFSYAFTIICIEVKLVIKYNYSETPTTASDLAGTCQDGQLGVGRAEPHLNTKSSPSFKPRLL